MTKRKLFLPKYNPICPKCSFCRNANFCWNMSALARNKILAEITNWSLLVDLYSARTIEPSWSSSTAFLVVAMLWSPRRWRTGPTTTKLATLLLPEDLSPDCVRLVWILRSQGASETKPCSCSTMINYLQLTQPDCIIFFSQKKNQFWIASVLSLVRSYLLICLSTMAIQRARKRFVNLAKQGPGRAMQSS